MPDTLDDGTLMGHPQYLASALHIIERDGPSLGLHLNRHNSFLEDASESVSSLPPDILIGCHGFSLPHWSPNFCEEAFQTRLLKVKVSLGAVTDIGDSQPEISPHCSCLAVPQGLSCLACLPPPPLCHSSLTRPSTKPWCLFWASPH